LELKEVLELDLHVAAELAVESGQSVRREEEPVAGVSETLELVRLSGLDKRRGFELSSP
jgi:hypothetical protein